MITVLAWVIAAYGWNIIFSVESSEIVSDAIALSVGLSDGKLLEIESEKWRHFNYLITLNCVHYYSTVFGRWDLLELRGCRWNSIGWSTHKCRALIPG